MVFLVNSFFDHHQEKAYDKDFFVFVSVSKEASSTEIKRSN